MTDAGDTAKHRLRSTLLAQALAQTLALAAEAHDAADPAVPASRPGLSTSSAPSS